MSLVSERTSAMKSSELASVEVRSAVTMAKTAMSAISTTSARIAIPSQGDVTRPTQESIANARADAGTQSRDRGFPRWMWVIDLVGFARLCWRFD